MGVQRHCTNQHQYPVNLASGECLPQPLAPCRHLEIYVEGKVFKGKLDVLCFLGGKWLA